MYKCDTCGKYVDELPITRETVGFVYGDAIVEEYVNEDCSCGGWFKETEVCKRCGDSEIADEFENGFCKKCQQVLFDKLKETFTKEEIDFLYENLEDLENET